VGCCESSVVHHRPGQSVLGLRVSKTVRLTVDGVERLTRAALHELAAEFVERSAH
jgi:hypothetical protein